jgi:hypothetical protein
MALANVQGRCHVMVISKGDETMTSSPLTVMRMPKGSVATCCFKMGPRRRCARRATVCAVVTVMVNGTAVEKSRTNLCTQHLHARHGS